MKQTCTKTAAWLKSPLLWIALATLLMVNAQPAKGAVAAETKLVVTASVLPNTNIRVLQQPVAVMITERDIARGYVEAPVTAMVRNNTRGGCLIEMEMGELPVRKVIVETMSGSFTMMPFGGMIPLQVMGKQLVSFLFRFVLEQEARPGNYGWPVNMSASPIM